jgi:hypothetical protein
MERGRKTTLSGLVAVSYTSNLHQYSHLTFVDEEGKELKSDREENLRIDVEEFRDGIEGEATDKFASTYSGTAFSFGLNQVRAGSAPPGTLILE